MSALTDHGAALEQDLASRYALPPTAIRAMMDAVARGGGTQAQFNVPELGGMGQWSAGGMTMVGDMFNYGLQATVSNLCSDISNAMMQGPLFQPPARPAFGGQSQMQGDGSSLHIQNSGYNWWPEELGQPSSQGAQNNLSYAIFPQARRLAININGQVTVYDTGDHMIGGVGQQQSGDASWTFTSQYGTVRVADLPVVSPGGDAPQQPEPFQPEPQVQAEPIPMPQPDPSPAASDLPDMSSEKVFEALEKLGRLREMGVLTDDEFATKKAELLARL